MTVTLHNTNRIVTLVNPVTRGEVPARLWEGETDTGIPVHAYITRIACHETADATQFEAELKEQSKPSTDVQMIPLRLIL